MGSGRLSRRSMVVGLVGMLPGAALAWSGWPAPELSPMPGLRPLNHHVLDVVRTYPFGSTHPYVWVPGTHTDGTTRDLFFRGAQVAEGSSDVGIHCSGITFEVWLRALERAGAPAWLSPATVLSIKETWYVRDGGRLGPVEALSSRRLGLRRDRLEDLQPGDLVQLWRNSGRGHTAVFLKHRKRRDGSIRGLAFWSAQSSSAGIGIRYASMGTGADHLATIHGVRPVSPIA